MFLGYELGVMPSLAGLQAGEDRLPGAFFSGLKKGLCYFSAFLATVLKGKNSQVQPEIINSFSVLWCGGLFSKSNKELNEDTTLKNMTNLWVQQLKHCKGKVFGFPAINC